MKVFIEQIGFKSKEYVYNISVSAFMYSMLLLLGITGTVFPQAKEVDPPIAKVGNLEIPESEFIYRLNFTPKEGIQDKKNSEGIKKELLYTLIAEKLWANEAIEEGLETRPSVIAAKNSIEKMFVRDALYKKEITDKINVSNDEISKGLISNSKLLTVGIFYSESGNSLSKIHDKLISGVGLNTVVDNIDTNSVIYKSVEISFGDLPAYIEDIIYGLNKNQYTQPIAFENGWNLYFLKDITLKKNINESEAYKDVLKILNERKEDDNYQKYYSEFFKGKKIDVDGKLFLELCEKISGAFNAKIKDGEKQDPNSKIFLDTRDVKNILNSFEKNEADEIFVRLEKDPINVEKFLREISFSSFAVPSSDPDTVKVYLNKKTKEYIKYELLAREGYRLGLDQLPEVKEWVKIWYENFLFQYIKNNVDAYEVNIHNPELYKENLSSKKSISHEKENPLFKDYIDETIELSNKYKFEIDQNVLNKVKQGNINLFVLRNLGFGGTISGVPSAPPFIEWYLELQKRKNQNPENVL